MGKTPQLRRAETGRFKQGRVAQAVRGDAVVFAHQGGNHRLIRGKTGDKQQRPRVAQPVGQLFLQRLMRRGVAADVPGATAAHAVTIRALLPGANDLRVLAQAQIIVAGEITEPLSFPGEKTACTVFHYPAHPKRIRRPPLVERGPDTCLPGHTAAAL